MTPIVRASLNPLGFQAVPINLEKLVPLTLGA